MLGGSHGSSPVLSHPWLVLEGSPSQPLPRDGLLA